MLFTHKEKIAVWGAVAGWLLLVVGMLVSYSKTAANQCSIISRLNFSESIPASVLLVAGFISFSVSIFCALSLFVEGAPLKSKLTGFAPIIFLVLAFMIVPFNTHDINFYYSAGEVIAQGKNIYAVNWSSHNHFYCPALVSSGNGFMYGPLVAYLLKGVYLISGGSVLVFIILWKVLQGVALAICAYLAWCIVRKDEKTDKQLLYLVWFAQPLMMWEWLANGHFDVLWVLFALVAIVAAMKQKWWLVLLSLTIGVWLKFVPLIIAPWFVLWWWQSLDKANWKIKSTDFAIGVILSLLLTYFAWVYFWQGTAILQPIILQTKWAVSSLFSLIYYSLKGLFVMWFSDQAHWILTRLVHAIIVIILGYFLLPLASEVLPVIFKKKRWQTTDFMVAIFITLVVYLGIWQKSFWPWYISWLLPLGVILIALVKNVYLKKIMVSLSIAPIYFYLVWLINHFTRGTDAPSELWFYYFVVLSIWVYPLMQLAKWRKTHYGLKPADVPFEKQQTGWIRMAQNIFEHPLSFVIRQLYRVFIAVPLGLLSRLYFKDDKKNQGEPTPICFFVTSIVYPKQGKAISYNAIRSIFTPEQRAEQTLRTVASIRAKIPEAKIILIEGGQKREMPNALIEQVDQYCYVGDSKLVRFACDSRFKSLGEAIMLLTALPLVRWSASMYFKISGRYFLNDEFDLSLWKEKKFTFLCIRNDYYSTRLYSFSKEGYSEWKGSLIKGLALNLIDYPIENTMAKYIPKDKLFRTKHLGLSGIGGASNDIIKE